MVSVTGHRRSTELHEKTLRNSKGFLYSVMSASFRNPVQVWTDRRYARACIFYLSQNGGPVRVHAIHGPIH